MNSVFFKSPNGAECHVSSETKTLEEVHALAKAGLIFALKPDSTIYEQAAATFNAVELAEAAALAIPAVPVAGDTPDPKHVFSTADAVTLTIAQTDTSVSDAPQNPAESLVVAPPAPPQVPAVPTAEPALVQGVEIDTRGLPWDSRIHASTKSKIANGQWKAKRNLDPAFVMQVETELFTAMQAGTTSATPVPPVTPTTPDVPAAPLPPTPPATAIVLTAPAATGANPFLSEAEPEGFGAMMVVLARNQAQGHITKEQIAEAVAAVELPSLTNLNIKPELIPTFWATLVSKVLS